MPVVAIPTDKLRGLLAIDLEDQRLSDLLEGLGCDVEGFAPVRRIRCSACGSVVERTQKDALPGACPECLTDVEGPVEAFWEDLGWENAIRIDLLPVRPDLFDAGGLARALRGLLDLEAGLPSYELRPPTLEVHVDPGMSDPTSYRPHIACAAVRGVTLDDFAIRAVMKLQEDLHWALGRDRKFASIGVYDLATLEAPFSYRPVAPDELDFVPLASADGRSLTPRQILEEHPKGLAYKGLLLGLERFPLLIDAKGLVLSVPPIINSQATALRAETTDLFIDVTGIGQRPVEKSLNILATSFAELFPKARLEGVTLVRDGKRVQTPDLTPSEFRLSPAEATRIIGMPVSAEDAVRRLRAMRHEAVQSGDGIRVSVAAYRNDILHEVDLIEDVAIAIGYENVPRALIPSFTQATERPERLVAQRARTAMLGLGFSEAMSLMLTNETDLYENLRHDDRGDSVRAENPASVEQRVVRTALAPCLLRLLAENRGSGIGHRVFELDDVLRLVDGHEEPLESLHLAAVVQDRSAGFADVKSVVVSLAREMGFELAFSPSRDPMFLEGRGAELRQQGRRVGLAGEVHPEVLERFSINVPVALFEVELCEPGARPAVQPVP